MGDPKEQHGMDATVAIRPVQDPQGSSDEMGELSGFVQASRQFVVDPRDLCWLLSQVHDVTRGELFAWLYQGYPARSVKALVLARALGDADLVRGVEEILHSGRLVPVSPVRSEDVLIQARHWAAVLSRTTGRAIDI
jgi:hypothetical protein